jgi:hypothetical protein
MEFSGCHLLGTDMPSVHCELFILKIHFSLKYLSVVFSIITMNFVGFFFVFEVGFCLFRSAKKFKKKNTEWF